MAQPSTRPTLYKGYRFPPEIISRCVWLYYRFGVSLRDVSELMLARGIEVSHETIRLWTLRLGTEYARRLRRRRGPCSLPQLLRPPCASPSEGYEGDKGMPIFRIDRAVPHAGDGETLDDVRKLAAIGTRLKRIPKAQADGLLKHAGNLLWTRLTEYTDLLSEGAAMPGALKRHRGDALVNG